MQTIQRNKKDKEARKKEVLQNRLQLAPLPLLTTTTTTSTNDDSNHNNNNNINSNINTPTSSRIPVESFLKSILPGIIFYTLFIYCYYTCY